MESESELDSIKLEIEPPIIQTIIGSTPSISSTPNLISNETFKVPDLPSITKSMPADIAHILALGLNEPDLMEGNELNSTSNYEQVVREMKENAGFLVSKNEVPESNIVLHGVIKKEESELDIIEEEMKKGGVSRPLLSENNLINNDMDVEGDELLFKVDRASSPTTSISSDDSSSSSDDSEELEARLVPAALRAQTTTITDINSSTNETKSKRTRKRPNKRETSIDSDLSEDDVNTSSAPKTEHEVLQPVIELPKITKLPEDSILTPFGKIMSVIDTVVVIKADTAGDWRVLDEGCICCWEDKTVIGNIFETFGSVVQPFYSVRFPATSLPDPEVFSLNKSVYYCAKLASFVFTQDIRGLKGSDASNVWDEEIGVAEMEWSDDEQEQEFKKNQKNERRARTASVTPSLNSRQSTPNQKKSTRENSRSSSVRSNSTLPIHNSLPPRPTTSLALPYDEDAYTPLQRPRDLHLINSPSTSTLPSSIVSGREMFERNGRGKGGDEFEFSSDDDEAETGSISSTFEVDERYRAIDEMNREEEEEERKKSIKSEQNNSKNSTTGNERSEQRGSRGNDRGRGGRGRGRGNFENGGRGGGGGGGNERGRGRGRGSSRGNSQSIRGNNQSVARVVAPLPSRPPIGLPAKPNFQPSEEHNSNAFSTTNGLPSFPSNNPHNVSSSNNQYNQSSTFSYPGQMQNLIPPPPPPPNQTSTYQFNPNSFQPSFGNLLPFPQYPQFPPSFFQSPQESFSNNSAGSTSNRTSISSTTPIPIHGGHFNPRFLGNNAENSNGSNSTPPTFQQNNSQPFYSQSSQSNQYQFYPQHQQQQHYQQQQSNPNYQQNSYPLSAFSNAPGNFQGSRNGSFSNQSTNQSLSQSIPQMTQQQPLPPQSSTQQPEQKNTRES